jgi:DNA (cytosine-5)-methyltransferase 1
VNRPRQERSVLGLFSGAGGLDLGFERAGFRHLAALEIEPWCARTLRLNRPGWHVIEGDVHDFEPGLDSSPDVLLAGVPCQGFSLGGNRNADDERNILYKQVVRVAKAIQPRVVVIENVLNMRTMKVPGSSFSFISQISTELTAIGYSVHHKVLKVSEHGVPQTRRRLLFVAFRGASPVGYQFPSPEPEMTIRPFLYDLAQGDRQTLPNHNPIWGFRSAVHVETGEPFDPSEEVVPVRFSRTASDGSPIRSFDAPFPAIDTATVWGWAQGNVLARRIEKDRANGKFIRNPESDVTLWRISASKLRSFTDREYARLQTFPDDWTFVGGNKRDVHLQIGNAVPVVFAERIARNVSLALDCIDQRVSFVDEESRFTQSLLFA